MPVQSCFPYRTSLEPTATSTRPMRSRPCWLSRGRCSSRARLPRPNRKEHRRGNPRTKDMEERDRGAACRASLFMLNSVHGYMRSNEGTF